MNKEELDIEVDRILHENKVKRRGARVFCVRCGNPGHRTPLRKWHNVYLCENCWKILNAIGEEVFIEEITKDGKENG